MNAPRYRSTLDSAIMVVLIAAGLAVSTGMEFGAVRPAVAHSVASLAARATTVVADATQATPVATATRWMHRRSSHKIHG